MQLLGIHPSISLSHCSSGEAALTQCGQCQVYSQVMQLHTDLLGLQLQQTKSQQTASCAD